ncbi:inositol-pentakisphosphate 2-kinase-like [Coffea eugenioides]|uniref:inositol-pentakisphosphate 2-kinase-like n=1 Tax=Coffea eugenioides TaxID=49369 RepID=UPI000F60AFF3|nr:inositol-pentakisphosphate 2-kinase-like [Coffea eugenioides]XP_027149688.1 inositol-pentakisphosphate 2-kinase-like [Coffea eugenioides]
MAVALTAKDADDWTYRGEGAVNLVLAYAGNSAEFVGKVLRIPKVSTNGSHLENGHSALTPHECLLWKDTADLTSAPTREIAEQLYVQHVMRPLLGSEHVDAGMRILVSKEFLVAIEKKVLSQRPSWRVKAAKVNPLCDSVLLISDHSVFLPGTLKGEFSLCVEIKPKCGFLPTSKFIAEGNAIKRSVTRFKMHQALKLHDRMISEISEYDPLDMFSGSRERIHRAIKALYNTPQNNFRVFLNGSLIFGGLGGGTKSTNYMVGQDFEDALKHVIMAEDGMRTEKLLELITEALFRSGLLDRLLEVQKLDAIDIEGVIHAYHDIVSQPCLVCRKMDADEFTNRYATLHSMPMEESLKIVRDYLIAATAKDLSMMLSFQPQQRGDVDSPNGALFLKSTNQSFDLKVSFIDLDMKPFKKVVYYYELDQQIVHFYVQMVETEPWLEIKASNQEMRDSNESILL